MEKKKKYHILLWYFVSTCLSISHLYTMLMLMLCGWYANAEIPPERGREPVTCIAAGKRAVADFIPNTSYFELSLTNLRH